YTAQIKLSVIVKNRKIVRSVHSAEIVISEVGESKRLPPPLYIHYTRHEGEKGEDRNGHHNTGVARASRNCGHDRFHRRLRALLTIIRSMPGPPFPTDEQQRAEI